MRIEGSGFTLIGGLERWLGLDADSDPITAARGRAAYVLSSVFILTQLVNLVGMTIDYGGWMVDHTIALGAVLFATSTVVALRWCKIFPIYAAIYPAVLVVGVTLSATTVGINSALLPMLVWTPLACGMVAGARSVIVGMAVSIGLSLWLYHVSTTGPLPLQGTEFQRLLQVNLGIIVSGAMAAVFNGSLLSTLLALQETADRARRAEEAKSDFLATMSHELRTPLNGVLGLTDALLAKTLGAEERVLAETMRASGQQLLGILNDLLDLSKIEAGKLTLEPAPFDPRALVRSVGDAWRETASARDTALHVEAAGEVPPWLEGDELRLRQVLNNFVSNAVKFTEGGHVTLSLFAEARDGGCALTFRVKDTGRGIPESQQAAVFEPFEQGETGTTRRYGGTGLGLPICRRLAEMMGGSVTLERSGPEGTEFALRLALPLAEAPRAAEPAAQRGGDLSGLHVLVAEDNAVNRLVAGEFLGALGVTYDFAEDGEEALRLVRERTYDAVLMDKHMPRMGGVDATRRIRALPGPAAALPIVAVTADAMTGEREALMAAGMDGFVSKPLKPDTLAEAILAVLPKTAAA